MAVGARLALAGDVTAVAAWVSGAAFISALALGLGVLTGTPRAFEAIYIVWWYTGPLQPVPVLDFMGTSDEAISRGMPLVYFTCALGLWIAATLVRRRRLRT